MTNQININDKIRVYKLDKELTTELAKNSQYFICNYDYTTKINNQTQYYIDYSSIHDKTKILYAGRFQTKINNYYKFTKISIYPNYIIENKKTCIIEFNELMREYNRIVDNKKKELNIVSNNLKHKEYQTSKIPNNLYKEWFKKGKMNNLLGHHIIHNNTPSNKIPNEIKLAMKNFNWWGGKKNKTQKKRKHKSNKKRKHKSNKK